MQLTIWYYLFMSTIIYTFTLITCVLVFLLYALFFVPWRKSSYRHLCPYSFWEVHKYHCGRFLMPKYQKIQKDGIFFEYRIFRELEKLPGYKKIIPNMILRGYNTPTTEIDIVLLHESGIYCIEAKDYRGNIYGSSTKTYWTQDFWKNRKFTFYNPLKQNYGHIKALEKTLQNYRNRIMSIVVFSDATNLNVNTKEPVIYAYELEKTILAHQQKKLSKNTIDTLYTYLSKYYTSNKQKRLEHIQNIQAYI